MNQNQFSGRRHFKSSGSIDLHRFIPWLAVPLGMALVLSWAMFLLYRAGHYYIMIVPILTALAVAGCVKLAVGKGHCRSPLAGTFAGVLAGLLLYGGYYYFGMIYHLGPEAALHPELLPGYVQARMRTDVTKDAGSSDRDDEPRRNQKSNTYMNWGMFTIEFSLVMGLTISAGLLRSRKPYCEACHTWLKREVTHFDPAQVNELLEAFQTESATALATLSVQPVHATVPNATLAAEVCPSLQTGLRQDCPSYVSLKTVTQAASAPGLDSFDASRGKLLFRSLELNSAEIAALASRITGFASIADPGTVRAVQSTLHPLEQTAIIGSVADISPLPAEQAGKVLTKRTIWIGNATGFAVLGLLALGIGLAAWGGMTAFPDDNSTTEVSAEKKIFGIALLVIGGTLFLATAGFFFASPSYFGNRLVRRKLMEEVSRRPDRLIEPNAPDALFVEIVPKLNWGKMMLENASDVGFLRIDHQRREILFEGDKERWRIPAVAITHCQLEFFVQGQGSAGATKVYFTVLRASQPGTFWEAPIRERTGLSPFQARKRLRAAQQLCNAIMELKTKTT